MYMYVYIIYINKACYVYINIHSHVLYMSQRGATDKANKKYFQTSSKNNSNINSKISVT